MALIKNNLPFSQVTTTIDDDEYSDDIEHHTAEPDDTTKQELETHIEMDDTSQVPPTIDNEFSDDSEQHTAESDDDMTQQVQNHLDYSSRMRSTILNFLPLGVFAFGGPAAYAILHERFVEVRHWLSEEKFLEYIGLCQATPGPSATQLVVAIAFNYSGFIGAIIAFFLWSIPCFVVAMFVGLGLHDMKGEPDWMSGLAPSAISLVFIATYKLGKTSIFHNKKISFIKNFNILIFISILSAIIILFVTSLPEEIIAKQAKGFVYPFVIFGGGIITLCDSKIQCREHLYSNFKSNISTDENKDNNTNNRSKYAKSAMFIIIWLVLFVTLLLLRYETDYMKKPIWLLVESLFRTGSTVYGGGQVILPMLFGEVVDTEWMTEEQFWTGFAMSQILPGPLAVKLSAYIGALMFGVLGSFIAWIALFAPGMLLMFAFLPIMETFKKWIWFQIMMEGINCAAIGLLVSACIKLWSSAVHTVADSCVVIIAASLVAFWKVPTPIAIICGGVLGFLFSDTVFGIGQKMLYVGHCK